MSMSISLLISMTLLSVLKAVSLQSSDSALDSLYCHSTRVLSIAEFDTETNAFYYSMNQFKFKEIVPKVY